MIDNHKDELDKTKEEYTKLKKALDELRASEVCNLHPDTQSSVRVSINSAVFTLFGWLVGQPASSIFLL